MAEVTYGKGTTEYGPGVEINLTGDEVALAIDAYLVAHRIYVNGPRTITVDGKLCKVGRVYVGPSGSVISDGERYSGCGSQLGQVLGEMGGLTMNQSQTPKVFDANNWLSFIKETQLWAIIQAIGKRRSSPRKR